MISGTQKTLKHRAVLSVTLFTATVYLAVGAAGQDSDWTMSRLMRAMEQVSSVTAKYTEERYLQYLTEPVRVEGVLIYQAPSHFEKRALFPEEEHVVIDGDDLTIETPGGILPTHARVSDYPALQGLIMGIRTFLAGDLGTLRRNYSIEYQHDGAEWSILLTPLEDDMREAVQELRLAGSADRLTRVQLTETSGTRTIIRITAEP